MSFDKSRAQVINRLKEVLVLFKCLYHTILNAINDPVGNQD